MQGTIDVVFGLSNDIALLPLMIKDPAYNLYTLFNHYTITFCQRKSYLCSFTNHILGWTCTYNTCWWRQQYRSRSILRYTGVLLQSGRMCGSLSRYRWCEQRRVMHGIVPIVSLRYFYLLERPKLKEEHKLAALFIMQLTCLKQPYIMFPNIHFVLICTSTKQPPALRSHLLCFSWVAA